MGITPAEVEEIFRAAGAFLEGHFVLSSGRHSPRYLEKFQVLQWPERTERLCAAIAERARDLRVETVAGPTTGGIILAHEVGRQLGVRAVYAEPIAAVRASGAEVVAAAVLVDRSGGSAHTAGVPYFALWEVAIDSYDPETCPQCAKGEPVRKPGTTPAAVKGA
jgi:orotate phosphoribosyltransferase